MRRSHVFFCHAGEDSEFAHLIASKMHADKIARPWIDTEHITTGVNILSGLRDGLSSMDIFIVLISQASLGSLYVEEEVNCALRRYAEGESLLIIPFLIDGAKVKDVERLHPFLLNRRVDRIRKNTAGAKKVIRGVHRYAKLPTPGTSPRRAPGFTRDRDIEKLLKDVCLGDWDSAIKPALEVLAATDDAGSNKKFHALAGYQECPDEDMAWGARMIMQTLVGLGPELFDRSLLISMARSSSFSIRESAASICLVLAQFAPDRVPLNILMSLARHDEDWYVREPATAALKSLCKARRQVLNFFFTGLQHSEPQGRAHAARALRGIAAKEPEILDAERLSRALRDLRRIRDEEAAGYIDEARKKALAIQFEDGFKYGLGR